MEGQGGGNPDLVVYKLTEGYVIYANGASIACNRIEECTDAIGRMLTAQRPDRPPEIGGVCEHPAERVSHSGNRHVCTQCGYGWADPVEACQHPQEMWRTHAALQKIICTGCGAEVGKLPPPVNPSAPPENDDWSGAAPKVPTRGGNVPRGIDAEWENLRRLAHGIVSGVVQSDQIWAIARQVCPHIPQVDIGMALDAAEHEFYETRGPEPGRLADGESGEYDPRMGPIRVPGDFGPEDRSLFGKEPVKWSARTAPEGMLSVEDGAMQCGCPGCAYEAGAGMVCVACHNGIHPHRMVDGREYSDRQGKSFVFRKGMDDGSNGRKVRKGQSQGGDAVPDDVPARNGRTVGKPRKSRTTGRRKRGA